MSQGESAQGVCVQGVSDWGVYVLGACVRDVHIWGRFVLSPFWLVEYRTLKRQLSV